MWGSAGTGINSCPKKIARKFPSSSWTGWRRTCPEVRVGDHETTNRNFSLGFLEVRHAETKTSSLHRSDRGLSKLVRAKLRRNHSRRARHRRGRKSVD